MKRGPFVSVGLVLLWSATVLAAANDPPKGKAPAPWKPPGSMTAPTTGPRPASHKAPVYIGGVLDTGQFLPDTTMLARVGDRTIRIGRYVEAFFSSYAEFRPKPDSLGRVEFLNSMINKEVLGLTALAINRPFTFEDRVTMRGFTERTLANVLFQRGVMDSVVVTDDDVRRVHEQFGWQVHLRHIRFSDPNTAGAVRSAVLAGKLSWSDAVKRYSEMTNRGLDGDMGWLLRTAFDMHTALAVWDLKPGEISPVLRDPDGFHIVQMVERRKTDLPALDAMRNVLREQIRAERSSTRADRLQSQVGARIGLAYDTTNIEWASRQFRGYETIQRGERGTVLNLGGGAPEIGPADTARVLARHRDGHYTLGDFLHDFNATSPIMRQPVGDFEAFRGQLDAYALESYMAEEARARGLERDSMAVASFERKREEMLVEHLYEDSVQSKVWIPPTERKKYYQDHIAQYVTYPRVRFAGIIRGTQAGADSLVARLKAGEQAADILRADSLAGVQSGSIQERSQNEHGEYHKLLFEELRPGGTSVFGPDKDGTWLVIQLLSFDPGRQLPYEEVQQYVDESLQNIRSEQALKVMLDRLKRRYRIEAHPELLMRVRLVDSKPD
jgi:parvulin-like peptidyl-prolyl cis-trans isomerase-like protein/PPIC-type peptidyl-prolyl cis-trans isomerase-like protein